MQETWIVLIRGIAGFERRSTPDLAVPRAGDIAKTRGVRDRKLRGKLAATAPDPDGAPVDPDRFRDPDDQWDGGEPA